MVPFVNHATSPPHRSSSAAPAAGLTVSRGGQKEERFPAPPYRVLLRKAKIPSHNTATASTITNQNSFNITLSFQKYRYHSTHAPCFR